MPTISIFFGIIIRMFYRDHNPPHFHAEYQGQNATFDFDGKLLEGEIDSRTTKSLIRKWRGYTNPSSAKIGRRCVRKKNLLELNL
jgi:hypothetical protein